MTICQKHELSDWPSPCPERERTEVDWRRWQAEALFEKRIQELREQEMKAPTQQQLNDPAWWDGSAPQNAQFYYPPTNSFLRFVHDCWLEYQPFWATPWKSVEPCSIDRRWLHERPTKPQAPEPMDDNCIAARIGEIGNQIHNLGCENQNDEDLSDRLGELAIALWDLAKHAPEEPEPKEWDGEKWPPIGWHGEIQYEGYWREFVSLQENAGAMRLSDQQWHVMGWVGSIGEEMQFRPIRTHAEREREEWINKAAKAAGYPECPATRKVCADIFDAGLFINREQGGRVSR